MMTPSLFNGNFDLFDRFYQDPWLGFDDHELRNMEKKLYGHRAKNIMNTDIKENDSGYEMTIDLPGFKKEDVNVALENGYLTISATKELEKSQDDKYIRRERYSGSCQRSFYVGEELSVEDIKANFKHGILTLSIPKLEKKAVTSNKYIAIEG